MLKLSLLKNNSTAKKAWQFVTMYSGYVLFACLMALSLGLGAGVLLNQVSVEKIHPIDIVATTIRNIPYCSSRNDSEMQYDLYLPQRTRSRSLPLVVFIHGGGWVSGDKRNGLVDYYGSDFINNNIAVASINYRLAPRSRYQTQNSDVACALRDISHRAPELGIDPSRIGLLGDSAGGLLAAMYALHQTEAAPEVRTVVEFYGTSDLSAQLTRFPQYDRDAVAYLGTQSMTVAMAASPLYQPIPKDVPPFLLLHGDKDTIVHPQQTEQFYEKLSAVNKQTQYVVVRGAGHYFTHNNTPTNLQIRTMVTLWFKKYLRGSET